MSQVEKVWNDDVVATEKGEALMKLLGIEYADTGIVGTVATERGPRTPAGLARVVLDVLEIYE